MPTETGLLVPVAIQALDAVGDGWVEIHPGDPDWDAWLLVEQATGHGTFAAPAYELEHQRWAKGDPRGGRFRPKIGADGLRRGPGAPATRPSGNADYPGRKPSSASLPTSIIEAWAAGPTLRGRKILHGHENTLDQHSTGHDVVVDGKVVGHYDRYASAEAAAAKTPGAKLRTRWKRSRAKLHAEILRKFLDGDFIEQDDGAFIWRHNPHAPKQHPEILSTAGGPASGKSRMLGANPALLPDDAVVVNPDIVKSQIPEYQELLNTNDPWAASATHEESSYLAKLLADHVAGNGYNAVLDVVGDSGPGKFVSKLHAFHRAGYRVRVAYAAVSTETALARARRREERTRRHVDPVLIQDAHRAVSARFEEITDQDWIEHIEVWSNERDKPELIAAGPGGKGLDGLTTADPDALRAFIEKKDEKGYL